MGLKYKCLGRLIAVKYQVSIQLKKEILDPEARAIQSALTKNHYHSLKEVTIAKQFTLELANDTKDPLPIVEDIVKNHLSNPLSETFTIKRLDS